MKQLKEFLSTVIFETSNYKLHVFDLLEIVGILFFTWLIVHLLHMYSHRKRKQGRIDEGKRYAIMQITSYFIWIIGCLVAVDLAGVPVTSILVGSTALLVGLGLGLQDFFRDLVAGFIILAERTITAGDIVEIGGTVGQVKDVGLRTTSLVTREDIILIVPNTRLTADNVINWSQNNKTTRFKVDVGVAYGSDTRLVETLLIECAKNHKEVMKNPPPYVFFGDFGDSSLNFSLFFFSKNLFRIERVKSDLRFSIDQAFRENDVTIPFPQRDVWFKNLPDTKPQLPQ